MRVHWPIERLYQALGGLGALLVVAQSLLYLTGGQIHVDEGTYCASGALSRDGFLPYRDFFYLQMPLYPALLSFVFRLFPESLITARCMSLVASLIGIGCLTVAAGWRDRRAGWLLLFLWGCSPFQLYFGIIARIFGLSVGFIGLSVLLRELSIRHERHRLTLECLALASFSLAVCARLTVLPGLAGAWLWLAWQRRNAPKEVGWLALGAAAPLLVAVIPPYLRDPVNAWFGMLRFHLLLTAGDGSALGMRARMVAILLQGYAAFVLVAAALAMRARLRFWRQADGYALSATIGLFAVHFIPAQTQPAYQTVTFPTAVYVLSLLLAQATRRLPVEAHGRLVSALALTGLAGIGAFGFNRYSFGGDQALLARQAAFLREHVAPGGHVVSSATPLAVMEAGLPLHRSFVSNEYFPYWERERCERRNVVNDAILLDLFASPETQAVVIGDYSYTMGFPEMKSIPAERRQRLLAALEERFVRAATFESIFLPNGKTYVYLPRDREGR